MEQYYDIVIGSDKYPDITCCIKLNVSAFETVNRLIGLMRSDWCGGDDCHWCGYGQHNGVCFYVRSLKKSVNNMEFNKNWYEELLEAIKYH